MYNCNCFWAMFSSFFFSEFRNFHPRPWWCDRPLRLHVPLRCHHPHLLQDIYCRLRSVCAAHLTQSWMAKFSISISNQQLCVDVSKHSLFFLSVHEFVTIWNVLEKEIHNLKQFKLTPINFLVCLLAFIIPVCCSIVPLQFCIRSEMRKKNN